MIKLLSTFAYNFNLRPSTEAVIAEVKLAMTAGKSVIIATPYKHQR
jgi:hypothetical protein